MNWLTNLSAHAVERETLQCVFAKSDQRASTTSFFVQLCTCPQCRQVSLLFVRRVVGKEASSTVRPVSVSFPVCGQRTRIRLIAFPTLGKERVNNMVLT